MKPVEFAGKLYEILSSQLQVCGNGRNIELTDRGMDQLYVLCENLVLNQNQEYNQAYKQPTPVPIGAESQGSINSVLGNTEPEFVPAQGGLSYSQMAQQLVEKKYELEELCKLVNARDETINSLVGQCNDLNERLNKVSTERNVMHNKLHDIAQIVTSTK